MRLFIIVKKIIYMIIDNLNKTNVSRYLGIVIIITLVLFSCSKDEDTFNCVPISVPDTYEYPVKPGTQEWIDLIARDARVKVCLIPKEILISMTTEGLLETLLNYPFILDYRGFEKMQDGFNMLKVENNGFSELYNRENLFQVIYDRYSSMSLNCNDIYPPIFLERAVPTSLAFSTLEMFIVQDEFLNMLDNEKRIGIFISAYDKHKMKIRNKLLESEKQVSAAILGRIMYKSKFKPFIDECCKINFLKFYIDNIPTYRPADILPVEIIEKYAEDFYYTIFN